MPDHDFLTTAQAAQAAQVSRPTISRSLKSGELHGLRDNSGAWRIKRDDLNAWINARASVQHDRSSHTVREQPFDHYREQLEQAREELAKAREQIARLEGAAGATSTRLEELSADRDAWRAQAERLAAAATREPADQPGRISRLLQRWKSRQAS